MTVRPLTFLLGIVTLLVTLSPSTAVAGDPRKARERMVELNKEALLAYDAGNWATARDLLNNALKQADASDLEGNNMTARTYVHLGAVQWTGFKDRAAAMQSFSMAKKIRPDIRLTPSLETPELVSMFDAAPMEPEGPMIDTSVPSEPTPPAPAPTPASPTYYNEGSDDGEPDLPASMSAPLMCTIPESVAPNSELFFRCALEPTLQASQVQVHFRVPGVESYQAVGLRRTPKGWYTITLPSRVMTSGVLQVYFDAQDDSGKQVASIGQIDSPSLIAVRKYQANRYEDDSEDPMAHIRKMAALEKYESGLHRRRRGAIWVSIGAGSGWGYVPTGNLEWEQKVKVSSLTTTTGLISMFPEVGYMWTDNFATSLQGRIEFLKQEQAMYKDPTTGVSQPLAANLSGAPSTMAPAAFLRFIEYTDITSSGNLRLSFSGDLGAGFIRFPVRPVAVVVNDYDPETGEDVKKTDYSRTIAKTDTRPVGMFLGGVGLGFLWNLSRYFAISIDGRVLSGLPNWGLVAEGGLSMQLAFGGVHGTERPVADDEEDEDRFSEGGVDDLTNDWEEEEE